MEKLKPPGPFDFTKSICETKKDILVDEGHYSPYMVNNALSYFPDTLFLASEMDRNSHISHRMQYDFYMKKVNKRKRFAKWFKAPKVEDAEALSKVTGISVKKAKESLSCLTEEQLKEVKDKLYQGGVQKSKRK